jgi:Lrp/AsnC family leucine-responsive transcriptional regulator
MVNIDLKDRKILYELDFDSRQSFRSIGKKVGLSKDIVASRVKKLEDYGIIKKYYAVIDYSKLGYFCYRIYLVFQNTNPTKEKEIINYFVNDKNVFWVCKAQGKYDLEMAIWIKSLRDFDTFWEKTLQKYRDYFSDQIVSVYLSINYLKSSYLLDKEFISPDQLDKDIAGLSNREKVDEIDYKILVMLANNSRIQSIEIAKKLSLNSITVSNRIKNLVKKGVIVGYRINIDFLKLDYEFYKVDINLNDYKQRKKIIDLFKRYSSLLYITKTAGYADLEMDFVVENVTELIEIIESVKNKLPGLIKNYNYFFQPKIHKVIYIPEK